MNQIIYPLEAVCCAVPRQGALIEMARSDKVRSCHPIVTSRVAPCARVVSYVDRALSTVAVQICQFRRLTLAGRITKPAGLSNRCFAVRQVVQRVYVQGS